MARNMVENGVKADADEFLGDLRNPDLEVDELDQAGNVVASYIASQCNSNDTGRIDVIVSFCFHIYTQVCLS